MGASNDESPAMVTLIDRASRSTRGKRMNTMLDEEIEPDELFWSREALEEEVEDDNCVEEQEVADELDSDFDGDGLGQMTRMYSNYELLDDFMRILRLAMKSMRNVLLDRRYDDFLYDKNMHCTARLVEMVNQYQEDLQGSLESDHLKDFLKEEIDQLQQTKAILPEAAFLNILQKKVDGISDIPVSFLEKVWNYIESLVLRVLMHHSEKYYQLQLCCKRVGHMAVAKMKERSLDWVTDYVEMQKTDYTCSPKYMDHLNELVAQQNSFIDAVYNSSPLPTIKISGFGCAPNLNYLRDCKEDLLRQAYDLRMRMTAYWKIIIDRLVDAMVLHIQLGIRNLVNMEIESALSGEFISTYERIMMEESPCIAATREAECKD